MGVVYKARDTKLDRLVALKVLPTDRVDDPERLRRFVLEAKAASALNHPNIITIHDIDSADGVTFIAMEYVKGKTLEQYLRARGGLTEILRYAAQMAGALAAAHEAGILHRDLKPGNVMVTDAGLVKVLDFGLAKLLEQTTSGEQGATATLGETGGTGEGKVVGTVGYMSPEQAEGKKLDARSDIFSFGSVLYEMVSGRRAFQGDTPMSTLSMVLRGEPKAVSEIAATTPRDLERVIQRCLRKDPAKRFQHMDDLKVAIEEIREETESGKLEAGVVAPVKRAWGHWAWAGMLVIGIAVGWAIWRGREAGIHLPVAGAPVRLTADSGLTRDPAYWPEGKLVAYASDRAGEHLDIWVQQLQGGEARRLTTNEADDSQPAFSPDGSKIAFRSERNGGGIYVIPAFGGTEKRLTDEGLRPRYSPNGKQIVYWVGDPMNPHGVNAHSFVIASDGGNLRPLPGLKFSRWPVWAGDSKAVAVVGSNGTPETSDLWVLSAEKTEVFRSGLTAMLKVDWVNSSIIPEGWIGNQLIYSYRNGDSSSLWSIELDLQYRVTGVPHPLTSGAAIELGASAGGGTLLFTSLGENTDIWSLPLDANSGVTKGVPIRLTSDLAPNLNCSIDADGKQVVYSTVRSGQVETVLLSLIDKKERVLASSPEAELGRRNSAPRINLAGTHVAYSSSSKYTPGFVQAIADGSTKRVCDACLLRSWAGDGKRLFAGREGEHGWLHSETGAWQQYERIALQGYSAPRASWDDRWLTGYRNLTTSKGQVYITPLGAEGPPSAPSYPISDGNHNDRLPEFSPDGNLMYFLSDREGRADLWAAHLDPANKKFVGEPFLVARLHKARQSPKYVPNGARAISVARDKIVYTSTEQTGNIWVMNLPTGK